MPAPTPSRNILFYCSGFYWIGGVESFEADLITSLPPDLAKFWIAAWSAPVQSLPLLTSIQKVADKFIRSPIRWGSRWNWPDLSLWFMARRMAAKADLIVFSKLIPMPVHLRLRALRKPDGRPIPSVLVIPYRPAELWPNGADAGLLDCFDVIVVPARSFADDLRKLGFKGQAEIINLIPPEPPITASIPPDTTTIRLGFLGRLEPPKNLPYLLEIMRELSRLNLPPIELHIYGDGSQRESLQQLAAAEPLASRVFFHGAVSGEDKWSAIDGCHIFVNPSTTEGQCIVALEVLSRGRPLLATPVGALPDILDNPVLGSLIPLNDAASAARAIARMAEDWRAGRIAPEAIKNVFQSRFGRKATVEAYTRLFQRLMK